MKTAGRTTPVAKESGRFAVFTSATLTYIDRASVLAESVRRFHDNADVYITFPDDAPPGTDIDDALARFDGVIRLEDIGLEADTGWIFSHNVVEFCTAVKPFALRFLLDKGYDRIVYLDPDIALFSPLDWVLGQLEHGSIALTPHQLQPEETKQAVVDNEICSLRYGVYNLGFVAIRNDANGRAFAKWWSERCYHYCLDEPEQGLFTDQKLCDLVPALFDNVRVLRHAGLNVASWNLSRRTITASPTGQLVVGGTEPLVFFHFTKINHVGEIMIKRYCSGSTMPLELMMWYRSQLRMFAVPDLPVNYWQFGVFADGSGITGDHRHRYRSDPRAAAVCADPFALTRPEFDALFPTPQ
jgi:hypothetical protein